MDGDTLAKLILFSAAGLIFLALLVGGVLVGRDTIRKSGRWGINLKPLHCPECGEPAPIVRRPATWRQALWGGCTCAACGLEYDKWGRALDGRGSGAVPSRAAFREMIATCVDHFGDSPREFSSEDQTYLRIVRPDWLRQHPDDELETLFRDHARLLRDGRVVWGHFIQANAQLYSPGEGDHPAEVVYSLDNVARVDPFELGRVAGSLKLLKYTKPHDRDLAPIADYLTDELTRVYGMPVPEGVSPRFRSRISTTFVVREHLPGRRAYLAKMLIPLIVSPTAPYVVLPLPSDYWPGSLRDWWSGSAGGVTPHESAL